MNKYKEWRELTDEGRLVEPKSVGPHYNQDNLNDNAPFVTDEDAIAEMERLGNRHGIYGHYVIVDIYVA